MEIVHEFTGGGPAQGHRQYGSTPCPKWTAYFDAKTRLSSIYGYVDGGDRQDGDVTIRLFKLHDIVTLDEAQKWLDDHQYEMIE